MRHANNCNCLSCAKNPEINTTKNKLHKPFLTHKKMRELFYAPPVNSSYSGEYTKDWEECFQIAGKVNCLSPNMWSLLCLANHWSNDIQLWAEDVLAGKNIPEEAEKENAKMKDGIKNWEEEAYNDSPEIEDKLIENGIADNIDNVVSAEFTETTEDISLQESKDKGCPCNFASTENCAECRDTDDQGNLKNS